MSRRIHRQSRRALGLIALLTVLVLTVAACGGEDASEASSPVVDKTNFAGQEPAAKETDRTESRTSGPITTVDPASKPSKTVLTEIDEKGGREEYVKYLASQEIDPFWAQQFAEWADSQQYVGEEGLPSYTSPRLFVVDKPLKTECGELTGEENYSTYCTRDTTLYFTPKIAFELAEAYGPFALALTVAHEWAHHVQYQLGYIDENFGNAASDSRAIENHADCLAGVWARSYNERGGLNRTAIFEGIKVEFMWGDRDPNDEDAWGTPEERVMWFLTGYTSGGFTGCSGALR